MMADLAEVQKNDAAGKAAFEGLAKAKKKEIAAATGAIEAKLARLGDLKVELETSRNDLADTKEALEADSKFLKDLEENCAQKRKEWKAYKKMMGEELLALADTIKLLNDDDALDLFKKTLPSPSLLQVQVSSKYLKQRALAVLSQTKRHHKKDFRLNLISMALRGK